MYRPIACPDAGTTSVGFCKPWKARGKMVQSHETLIDSSGHHDSALSPCPPARVGIMIVAFEGREAWDGASGLGLVLASCPLSPMAPSDGYTLAAVGALAASLDSLPT
jgi:hypothetical protein